MYRYLATCLLVVVWIVQPASARELVPLRIQYIVGANDARTADFTKFLQAEFAKVTVTPGKDFDPKATTAYDVLIVDTRLPKPLPADFTRPILLLGSNGNGATAISENGLWTAHMAGSKFDWLCLCLDNKAYDVNTKHAIFRTPYAVTPTLKKETNLYTKRSINAWLVHEKAKGPGLVSSADHFRGAADSEIISGGINMKGDRGVCLVREGHTFLWGFAGTPSQMTDEARKVFVNAVVFIKQFDGQKQTVQRGVIPRTQLQEIVSSSAVFRSQFNRERYFAPDVAAKFGADQAKYRALFESNKDFIYVPNGLSGLKVDEEAKQLGIPNNDVRLLERCVAMLEKGEKPELANTLLERYTGEKLASPQAWRAWLTKSRDKLFFLDSHGYRFFTEAPSAPPAKWQMNEALADLKVSEPTNVAPVSTGVTLVSRYARNDKGEYTSHMDGDKGVAITNPGDVMTLVVRMRVAEPWHIYANAPDDSTVKLTKFDVQLPAGLRFVGDWKTPAPKASETPGQLVYEGDLLFTRDVLVTAGAGPLTVAGTVQYQACDPQRCLPPQSEPIKLALQISER